MKTFSLNSDTTNRASFPIRGSMFKNSNYLRIWNQLTSYYDKVSYHNIPNKIDNVLKKRITDNIRRLWLFIFLRRIFWLWTVTSLLRIQSQFSRVLRGSFTFHLSLQTSTSHTTVIKYSLDLGDNIINLYTLRKERLPVF